MSAKETNLLSSVGSTAKSFGFTAAVVISFLILLASGIAAAVAAANLSGGEDDNIKKAYTYQIWTAIILILGSIIALAFGIYLMYKGSTFFSEYPRATVYGVCILLILLLLVALGLTLAAYFSATSSSSFTPGGDDSSAANSMIFIILASFIDLLLIFAILFYFIGSRSSSNSACDATQSQELINGRLNKRAEELDELKKQIEIDQKKVADRSEKFMKDIEKNCDNENVKVMIRSVSANLIKKGELLQKELYETEGKVKKMSEEETLESARKLKELRGVIGGGNEQKQQPKKQGGNLVIPLGNAGGRGGGGRGRGRGQ